MPVKHFLIPMYYPQSGRGTREDPIRPKYVSEMGVEFSTRRARKWAVVKVRADQAKLDELAARQDVVPVFANLEKVRKALFDDGVIVDSGDNFLQQLDIALKGATNAARNS